MAEELSFQDMKTIDKWWQRGIAKERVRHLNKPKPIKNDRFAVPQDFNNFAPPFTRAKKVHATHHR